MATVKIDKTIFRRIESLGLLKELSQFVYACENGRHPPRIYKPSGIAKDGSKFEPYLKLKLHHHHLHRSSEPLLVTQHIGEIIQCIALARHEEYTRGDKLLWLKANADAIEWNGCEDIERLVRDYDPDGASMPPKTKAP